MRHTIAAVGSAVAVVAGLAVLSRLRPDMFAGSGQTAAFLTGTHGRLAWPLNYWNGLAALMALGLPLLLAIATSARTLRSQAARRGRDPADRAVRLPDVLPRRGARRRRRRDRVRRSRRRPDSQARDDARRRRRERRPDRRRGASQRDREGSHERDCPPSGRRRCWSPSCSCAWASPWSRSGSASPPATAPCRGCSGSRSERPGSRWSRRSSSPWSRRWPRALPSRLSHAWTNFKKPVAAGLHTNTLARFGVVNGNGRYQLWQVAGHVAGLHPAARVRAGDVPAPLPAARARRLLRRQRPLALPGDARRDRRRRPRPAGRLLRARDRGRASRWSCARRTRPARGRRRSRRRWSPSCSRPPSTGCGRSRRCRSRSCCSPQPCSCRRGAPDPARGRPAAPGSEASRSGRAWSSPASSAWWRSGCRSRPPTTCARARPPRRRATSTLALTDAQQAARVEPGRVVTAAAGGTGARGPGPAVRSGGRGPAGDRQRAGELAELARALADRRRAGRSDRLGGRLPARAGAEPALAAVRARDARARTSAGRARPWRGGDRRARASRRATSPTRRASRRRAARPRAPDASRRHSGVRSGATWSRATRATARGRRTCTCWSAAHSSRAAS